MASVDGAVESLVVFRQRESDGLRFHVHWKTTKAKLGCVVKDFGNEVLYDLTKTTLARLGLAESALTGDPRDESTQAKIILNFQRHDSVADSLTNLGTPTIDVLLTLPGKPQNTIPIPVSDRSFNHYSMNPSHYAPEEDWLL